MIIKQFTGGILENNMYLLLDETSKKAVLIDAPEFFTEVVSEAQGFDVEYILLTHGHFDHILGLDELRAALNAKALINENDLIISDNVNEFTAMFALPPIKAPIYDGLIEDGDEIDVGNMKINVIATPGHTQGGVCYLIDGNLFSGDTLFRESVGRTDLFGGDFKKLKNSIKNKLFKLDDKVKVFPGHGGSTTIGYEKKFNELAR